MLRHTAHTDDTDDTDEVVIATSTMETLASEMAFMDASTAMLAQTINARACPLRNANEHLAMQGSLQSSSSFLS